MLNGSPHPKGCTYTALHEVAAMLNAQNIETEIVQLGNKPVHGCTVCGKCATTGNCIFTDDPTNEYSAKLRDADGFIVGSPVFYASPNGALCAMLDRMFFMKSSEYALKPAAAVVSCRRGGATAAFDNLNKYFTIASMPVVSSQYWNMVHGNTPEEVRKDAEGLQTMRTLGRNMAWLLKCIEAGNKAGVPLPEQEDWIATNFIR